MDTLLNFSGGIDSTYCLYTYLKNNPKNKLLVHFIELNTPQGRLEYEKKAVYNILNYLKLHSYTNFKFVTTKLDYGTLNYRVLDMYPISFFTGVVIRKFKDIKYVIQPLCLTELNWLNSSNPNRYLEMSADREAIVNTVGKRKMEYLFPIIKMTKHEVIKSLPKDLYQLVWYCRKPLGGKPCRDCHTCIQVKGAY